MNDVNIPARINGNREIANIVQAGGGPPGSPYESRIAALNTSTEGTGASLPDSSLNTLQEIPGISPGRISSPLINTDGDPIRPSLFASVSSIV